MKTARELLAKPPRPVDEVANRQRANDYTKLDDPRAAFGADTHLLFFGFNEPFAGRASSQLSADAFERLRAAVNDKSWVHMQDYRMANGWYVYGGRRTFDTETFPREYVMFRTMATVRDRYVWDIAEGMTAVFDLIKSSDKHFRPVDPQIGPDAALWFGDPEDAQVVRGRRVSARGYTWR